MLITKTASQTEKAGFDLGVSLKSPCVIWLFGEIGAGKTVFASGLIRGLGYEGIVTSPTFTLVNEYEGRLPVFHFDIYRLSGVEDLFSVGWQDYLDRRGVCIVEWSQKLEYLPDPGICVYILSRGETREITIDNSGD